MKNPILLGKLNKWHFYILGIVAMKLFNQLISGISCSLENPDDKFYLLGYQPNFTKHPFIQSSFSFFGIFLVGLFLYILKKILRKQIYKEEGLLEIKNEIKQRKDFASVSTKVDINDNKCELFKESIFAIFIFVFAILSLSIYDSSGFNDVKIWPLEYLIIIYFSKKYLKKNLYKHQKLAVFLILIFCNIGCIFTSFMPDDNKK